MAKITLELSDIEHEGAYGVSLKVAKHEYGDGEGPENPATTAMMTALTIQRLWLLGILPPMIAVVCQDHLRLIKDIEAEQMASVPASTKPVSSLN